MNENNKKTATFKDRRRYKYGSLSVVFTVVFIALILVINLVFSSLSISGDLTVDLTQEEFSTIGDETVSLLTELGKDLDVKLYFMSPRDQFDLEVNNYNGVNLTGIVRDLAENYANYFDGSGDKGKVEVFYKELDKDPEFEKKYLEESTTQLSAASLIVQGKHHYRVLNITSFFVVDDTGAYSAFNGEYRLTTAILQSSIAEAQVVTFTRGHGEPVNGDNSVPSDSNAYGLATTLADAGFEIKTCDLASEEIDSRTEILICYDPVTDLSYDEVDKITDYLAGKNAFMTFVDSGTPALPNLQSCLNDNWGINYKPFYRVTDETHSLSKSSIINAKYPEVDADSQSTSAAYQISKTAFDVEGTINTALPESVELEIRPEITKDGFLVETVLSTYDTAVSTSQQGETGTSGEMPLMLLSTKSSYGENNAYEYSYVMLVGSTDFASTSYLADGGYGNKRIVLSAARAFGANRVAPDILSKKFASTALDIELGTANTLTWLICTIVPGILIILGLVVFFKRRHM